MPGKNSLALAGTVIRRTTTLSAERSRVTKPLRAARATSSGTGVPLGRTARTDPAGNFSGSSILDYLPRPGRREPQIVGNRQVARQRSYRKSAHPASDPRGVTRLRNTELIHSGACDKACGMKRLLAGLRLPNDELIIIFRHDQHAPRAPYLAPGKQHAREYINPPLSRSLPPRPLDCPIIPANETIEDSREELDMAGDPLAQAQSRPERLARNHP